MALSEVLPYLETDIIFLLVLLIRKQGFSCAPFLPLRSSLPHLLLLVSIPHSSAGTKMEEGVKRKVEILPFY